MVLWGNFSYPTALTTRWLNLFYTLFTLRSMKNYPYFWTSGINLVSQSSQLYKIRVLPAKIKLLIIWVEIIFCQQQKKTTPNNLILPDFLFKLFIVQSYSRYYISWILIGHKHSFPVWMEEWERKKFWRGEFDLFWPGFLTMQSRVNPNTIHFHFTVPTEHH